MRGLEGSFYERRRGAIDIPQEMYDTPRERFDKVTIDDIPDMPIEKFDETREYKEIDLRIDYKKKAHELSDIQGLLKELDEIEKLINEAVDKGYIEYKGYWRAYMDLKEFKCYKDLENIKLEPGQKIDAAVIEKIDSAALILERIRKNVELIKQRKMDFSREAGRENSRKNPYSMNDAEVIRKQEKDEHIVAYSGSSEEKLAKYLREKYELEPEMLNSVVKILAITLKGKNIETGEYDEKIECVINIQKLVENSIQNMSVSDLTKVTEIEVEPPVKMPDTKKETTERQKEEKKQSEIEVLKEKMAQQEEKYISEMKEKDAMLAEKDMKIQELEIANNRLMAKIEDMENQLSARAVKNEVAQKTLNEMKIMLQSVAKLQENDNFIYEANESGYHR